MYRFLVAAGLVLVTLAPAVAQPVVDHHQHLFSPALAALISPAPPAPPVAPITAAELIRQLDDAGIRRAVVLSTAYIFGQPSRNVPDERERVRADNDWTSAQVAQFPQRLVGFCGISPLKDYALEEIDRCARDPNLRRGIKLHFGNAVVDYHKGAHVERVRQVFRAANAHRMAVVVHLQASITARLPYGRDEARIFIDEILPAAPDVDVQVAHLAGAGPGYPPNVDAAVQAFVEAIERGDPRTARLWFDVTTAATPRTTPEQAALLARRIRQLGVGRILYGSDASTPGNAPRTWWTAFRALPLTDAEFRTIAANEAPYLR